MKQLFEATVSALAYSIVREECSVHVTGREGELNRVVKFVLGQRARMPDLLALPMMILTLVSNCQSLFLYGALFNRLNHEHRWQQILVWRNSRFGDVSLESPFDPVCRRQGLSLRIRGL